MYARREFVRRLSALAVGSAVCPSAGLFSGNKSFADDWLFSGVAIKEADYHVWCASPIMDEKGQVHLFASRWPKSYRVDPGWRSHSEIAHYVADSPAGPFHFSEVALRGTGTSTWDRYGVHNPNIHKVGDTYVLLYIANDEYHQPPHPANQRIGMAIANQLNGPWEKVNDTGMLLSPPDNPAAWNYKATNGVNNPSLLQYKGLFYLYFKSANAKMGLAISDTLTGPYRTLPHPVTLNDKRIEDGYAFVRNQEVCMLTTDNDGIIKKGGGLLWRSSDGIQFTHYEAGYHLIDAYVPDASLLNPVWHYGAKERMKFERPQLLLLNGEPAWLYVTSGCSIYGGDTTVSYVLKRRSGIV